MNTVALSSIRTPLQVSDGQSQDALPAFGHNVPLGRVGQPVEVAPAYAFLVSAESSYVMGEGLNVNGGKYTP